MIRIILAFVVVGGSVLVTPGISVERVLAFQYSTNAWTGTTARSNSTQSGLVVTITPTAPTTAITPVSSTLGLYGFTATNFAPPLPTGAATALVRTTASGCAPSATPCTGRGTLTVAFEHPTRNPVLYLSGLGGYQQVGANQSQLQVQLTLATAGLTLSQTAGSNLTVSGNVVRPSSPLAGISCTTKAQGAAVPAGALGGCGSLRVNGLVTSVAFDLAILNTVQAGIGVTPTGTNGDEFGVTVSFDEDFSDGPASYDGGIAAPRSVLTDLVLGSGITADSLLVANASVSPINSATATGDTDDAFSAPFAPLRPGVTTTYSLGVPYSGASKSGTLCGWIDFNRNGAFLSTGPGEERECGAFAAGSGVVTLTWSGITGLVAGDSFARFRIGYTSSQTMNPLSNGDSGEIEDYLVPITNAAIELTKSAVVNDVDGDGVVAAGETITYSLSVRNSGTVPVEVSVVDPLLGGSVPCGTGSLVAGATRACPDATYTVLQSDIGTTITNIATATGRPVTGSNAVATASTDTNLPIVARVELDKTAGVIVDVDGNGVDVGDTITYSFAVTNTGNVDLGSVTLTDALLDLSGSACGTGSLAPTARRVCPDVTYIVVQSDIGTTITNTATVAAIPATGGNVTNTDTASTPIQAVPAVELDKTAGVTTTTPTTTTPVAPLTRSVSPPTSAVGPGSPDGSSVLPVTGSSAVAPAALASILMLLLGGGLILAARVRRPADGPGSGATPVAQPIRRTPSATPPTRRTFLRSDSWPSRRR
ncbi:MAG: GEVED domain-containing protein [Ilumatobacteraceae bacterium]